jgi:prolyl-tRNA editing enzyme YbaK/EbsC (Cys-tRNA(Pro) deacylase)
VALLDFLRLVGWTRLSVVKTLVVLANMVILLLIVLGDSRVALLDFHRLVGWTRLSVVKTLVVLANMVILLLIVLGD